MSVHDHVVRYAVERLGIPESDIRDYRMLPNMDVIELRLHNWRKFRITGLEQHNWISR